MLITIAVNMTILNAMKKGYYMKRIIFGVAIIIATSIKCSDNHNDKNNRFFTVAKKIGTWYANVNKTIANMHEKQCGPDGRLIMANGIFSCFKNNDDQPNIENYVREAMYEFNKKRGW